MDRPPFSCQGKLCDPVPAGQSLKLADAEERGRLIGELKFEVFGLCQNRIAVGCEFVIPPGMDRFAPFDGQGQRPGRGGGLAYVRLGKAAGAKKRKPGKDQKKHSVPEMAGTGCDGAGEYHWPIARPCRAPGINA